MSNVENDLADARCRIIDLEAAVWQLKSTVEGLQEEMISLRSGLDDLENV